MSRGGSGQKVKCLLVRKAEEGEVGLGEVQYAGFDGILNVEDEG